MKDNFVCICGHDEKRNEIPYFCLCGRYGKLSYYPEDYIADRIKYFGHEEELSQREERYKILSETTIFCKGEEVIR